MLALLTTTRSLETGQNGPGGDYMILRRLVIALRKQDWFTVLIETLIVVFGVFIGLQVNNWNESRNERQQERGLLVRLHEDIVESLAGQSRDLAFLEQQLADQVVFLRVLDACAVDAGDAETVQRAVNTLGFINPPRFQRRTIDEMAAVGRLDIIRNESLKTRLAEIVAMVEWRAAGYDGSARLMETYRVTVDQQVRFDLTRLYPDPFLGHFVGVDFDISVLCANSGTASSVSAISYLTRERENAYRQILDQYQAFLPTLEAELNARWGVQLQAETAP